MTGDAVPEPLDPRLAGRDPADFDRPDEFLRYQRISRGKNPAGNVHWTLDDDGDLRVAWYEGAVEDPMVPFSSPIPTAPNAEVPRSVVRKLRRALRREHFASVAPYQRGETAKGGDFHVITARVGDGVHEVIYDAPADVHDSKLLSLVQAVTEDHARRAQ